MMGEISSEIGYLFIKFIIYFTLVILFIIALFLLYSLAKHGSYALWYEDMVKETIQEMVKGDALK
jgi:hypothetical protein